MGPDKRFELTEENGTFGDIVLVDAIENVATLTNKTLAIINWAHHHVKFSYMLKCDDDTYVFVKNMIVELRKRPTTTKLYYGKIIQNSPTVHGNFRWADETWDLGPAYLPFAIGGGYILSHDLVAILSEVSPHLKWHVNEDTAIGAWISAFDHERRSDEKICQVWKSKTTPECEEPILAFLFFGYSNDELKKLFRDLRKQVKFNKNITLPTSPTTATVPNKDHKKETKAKPTVTPKKLSNVSSKTKAKQTTKSEKNQDKNEPKQKLSDPPKTPTNKVTSGAKV